MANGNVIDPKLVRFPLIPLPYESRNTASPREILLDYENSKLYVVDDAGTGYIDIVAGMVGDINTDIINVVVGETTMSLTTFITKLAMLNEDGKLEVGTTGDAGSVDGYSVSDADTPLSTDLWPASKIKTLIDAKPTLDGNGDITVDTTGNAATATKLLTAKNIQLSGDVTGSVSFDGSSNVNMTTTVVNDSHGHIIADIDDLQTALDSKPTLDVNGDINVDTTGDAATVGGYSITTEDSPAENTLWPAIKIATEFSGINSAIASTSMALNTARHSLAGCGNQSSALSFGGKSVSDQILANTEKFNGSVWSNYSGMVATRYLLCGFGTMDAAVGVTGIRDVRISTTEKFNGSVWATSGNINTARSGAAATGIQNAGLITGGETNSVVATGTTEKFNGSVWSAVSGGDLIVARNGFAVCGLQNAALAFGGSNSSGVLLNTALYFNGTIWSTTFSISAAKNVLSGCGNSSQALAFGGHTAGGDVAVTEKFNEISWSTTGLMNSVRSYAAGCGEQNAGLAFGGGNSGNGAVYNTTEKFNTSLWINLFGNDIGSMVDNKVDSSGGTITGLLKANIIDAESVSGGVFNDYAEYRQALMHIKPGTIAIEDPDDDNNDYIVPSTDRLLPNPMVVSDTFGFSIGERSVSNEYSLPIAVSGRVLVYTDESRLFFRKGDVVCSGPNGTVSKMTREEIIEYPDRILGVVSSIPDYLVWGANSILVNGRIWIRIR